MYVPICPQIFHKTDGSDSAIEHEGEEPADPECGRREAICCVFLNPEIHRSLWDEKAHQETAQARHPNGVNLVRSYES